MNKIALVAQSITAIAAVVAVAMVFMILRDTETQQHKSSDAEYFRECYQAFITEFPLTKYKGTTEEYLAEARNACP